MTMMILRPLVCYLVASGLAFGASGADRERRMKKPKRANDNTRLLSTTDDGVTTGNEDSTSGETVQVACFFDAENFPWAVDLLKFAVQLINNKTDGWHDDDIFPHGKTQIELVAKNSKCSDTVATKAYMEYYIENNGSPPHAILGARCSGASMALALVSFLEKVFQVSPTATSPKLEDNATPFFTSVASPEESMAMAVFLRSMGWNRVSVLTTDTQWTRDWSTAFHNIWEDSSAGGQAGGSVGDWHGEVAKSATIRLTAGNTAVDRSSLEQALDSIPTDDPTVNSRIVVLAAHHQHALEIIRIATELNFQPDTIWVLTDLPESLEDLDKSFMPEHPGYFSMIPYRFDHEYSAKNEFLRHLREFQIESGLEPWEDFPSWEAEHLLDSLLAIALTLSSASETQRRNGTYLTQQVRQQSFLGMSGLVEFTQSGDRDSPSYSILHLKDRDNGDVTRVARVGTDWNSMEWEDPAVGVSGLCFPGFGCGLETPPPATYPVPLSRGTQALIGSLVAVAVIGLVVLYFCVRKTEQVHKVAKANENLEAARADLQNEIQELVNRQELPAHWSTETSDILVEVSSNEEEYWDFSDRLRETLPDAHIAMLWRIQNEHLYAYCSFHKQRFRKANIPISEERVWHGTSALDPKYIYGDTLDGWMMQYAEQGMWGRGTYFAERAEYSDDGYFFHPAGYRLTDRATAEHDDERELLLANLLVGDSVELAPDDTLITPPMNDRLGRRYTTVTGHTNGSKVFIVYENGRAYPEYLVRYYVGDRDENRTPYESREAMRKATAAVAPDSTQEQAPPEAAPQVDSSPPTWCYEDDDLALQPFSGAHQAVIEAAFVAHSNDASMPSKVLINSNDWTYIVDIVNMVQHNTETSKKRGIKRLDKFDEEEAAV